MLWTASTVRGRRPCLAVALSRDRARDHRFGIRPATKLAKGKADDVDDCTRVLTDPQQRDFHLFAVLTDPALTRGWTAVDPGPAARPCPLANPRVIV